MNRAIAWMAGHPVASNLLMVFILAAGVFSMANVVVEVFPDFDLGAVQVRVEYPGASPEEVEEGIIQKVEERVEAIEGVSQINSTASEGVGVVFIELNLGEDVSSRLDEIKAEVDRITSFPADAEKPEVTEVTSRSRVMEIAVHGDAPERTLKELANRIKDDLSSLPEISFVQTSGVRDYEISIEVSNDVLRSYGISLDDVAMAVRRASLDLPGGRVDTDDEEILVRVKGRNYNRDDFAKIIVRGSRDGSTLRLDQIATIKDGFQDADLVTLYNDEPAAFVQVFRTSDEQVLEIVRVVESYLDEIAVPSMPKGVEVSVWQNDAELLESRINLLRKNGIIGLILVLIALTLFLDLRLSSWVAVGISLSFIGTFAVMPWFDISINMMSLFGFILAIGIVVDDAIVVGENIYSEREKGRGPLEAAIKGTQRVAVPVVFAVLTTVTAFTPLLFVPGSIGKFLKFIPMIVIAVLLFSLIESLFILPHHLSRLPEQAHTQLPKWLRPVEKVQRAVQAALQRFIDGPVDRTVRFATDHYGVVISSAIALVLISMGLVAGRYISFSFLPRIEGDNVIAQVEMPQGTPSGRTQEVASYIEAVGRNVADSLAADAGDDHPSMVEAVYVSVGRYPSADGGPGAGALPTFVESNKAEINFRLLDAEQRDVMSSEFEKAWREAVGDMPGPRSLTFSSQVINLGAPVQLEVSHPDTTILFRAAAEIQEELQTYAGVFDVRNDQDVGKREVELTLKPRARTLGVTLDDLARQVRAAFFGSEALRVQRGREEVRVYVRLPKAERSNLDDIRQFRVMTPAGEAIPLEELADVSFGTAPSTIRRVDGRRIVTVTAEVDRSVITGSEANAAITSTIMPAAQERYPALRYGFGGEQREQTRALGGMIRGFILALFVMYTLLAIPFGSYIEPLIIMAAVPFGFIGAVFSHLFMGIDLGMLSMFGLVGLSGVVVNDSLVLLDFVKSEHREGKPMNEAILSAARIRFRPIILTTMTTFLGVFPMIIERSVQAQFLVPMAVSLGLGILFATFVIIVLVPALTMLQYDVFAWWAARRERRKASRPEPEAA
ncbi:MAG: efflux RND transporter permease subunit [marine benthic group bacterium]|nr:efflux RND transporter permease subunit [Gemmatimonadota bacterium]MCL7957376.1 efflux RND transporter permease subunit [Gemmatimonadota bacterium]MCL7966181.1 efflux RND transporter permease subunit [Gemmatimonadota bacterium]MCL7968333.1 efflux RND transporter permease subunit [Gemmatimonadota bacterium]MCL7979684.1 efflux RND transporter permease subunit [Gemmatimonadota bacterium]